MERNSCRTMRSGGQWPVVGGREVPPRELHWQRAKRTRESSFSHRAPPSARQLELAESPQFLEKNAHFGHREASLGGGGRGSKRFEPSCGALWLRRCGVETGVRSQGSVLPGHSEHLVARWVDRRKSWKQLSLEAVHVALWPWVVGGGRSGQESAVRNQGTGEEVGARTLTTESQRTQRQDSMS
jgi:hypothetical protein